MHVIHLVYQLAPDMLLIGGLWQPWALSQLRLQKVLVGRNRVPSGNISVSIPLDKSIGQVKADIFEICSHHILGKFSTNLKQHPHPAVYGEVVKIQEQEKKVKLRKKVVSRQHH